MSDWFGLARRVHVGDGCGAMRGGKPRAIHHTTEGSSISGAIATYRKTHNYPTFTIDYALDDVVQHLAASIAATAVQNSAGGVDTNREGKVCIQIEWVGFAEHPFTTTHDGALIPAGPNVRAFFDWLRDLGIPDEWPMGAPKPYPASYGLTNGSRDPNRWVNRAGHYGHSQVPENHHGDPGAIDPKFIRQSAEHFPTLLKKDDDMAISPEGLKQIDALIQKRVDDAVAKLHAEHVLILHGDEHHPISLDSIAEKLGMQPR